jgi:hypothetical protein
MKWIKRGRIFDPTQHGLDFDCTEFAQSPQTLVFDDFVRIYFSTRRRDTNGKFLSHIAFVDFDLSMERIINYSKQEVIPLGGLGCFDEHGIFPINPLKHGNAIWAYTCGWSRRVSVSVETSTGLAISEDGGNTFKNIGPGPVLSASPQEPMLVGDSFVQVYDGVFHMWYIFGKYWLQPSETEPAARVYKIAYATSANGIEWHKHEGQQIIADVLNEHECQALPTVVKHQDTYHMFFCFREATDFRKNPSRGYRLGYAHSKDLKTWQRDDTNKGIDFSTEGWDSEMMCYPHLFQAGGKVYLLYNGNEFGKYGFGLAELTN